MARASAAASWICSARCFCVSFVPRLPLVRRQVRGLSPRGERLFCLALQECRRLAACFFQRAGLGASASTVCCVCLFPLSPLRWGCAVARGGVLRRWRMAAAPMGVWLHRLWPGGYWHCCCWGRLAYVGMAVFSPFMPCCMRAYPSPSPSGWGGGLEELCYPIDPISQKN